MEKGLKVSISAPGRGTAAGVIEDIRTRNEMPNIDGFDITGETRGLSIWREYAPRSILAEWKVSRVAVISYTMDDGLQVMFTALEIDGRWWDLKRQQLTLEVITPG